MKIFHDKYALAAIAAILIVSVVCLTDLVPEPSLDIEVTGVVTDVKRTQNGFTFVITDASGTATKCFHPEGSAEGSVCTVSGRFSDDGSILFANRVTVR